MPKIPEPNGEDPLIILLYPCVQSRPNGLIIEHVPSVDIYIQGRGQSGQLSLIHFCQILEKFSAEATPGAGKQQSRAVLDAYANVELLLAVTADKLADIEPT